MSRVDVVRAGYLNVYLGLLREIGVPTGRALSRARLPSAIETMPDAYVSITRAADCVLNLCRDVSAVELGALVMQRRPTLDTLSPALRAALLGTPTGAARLRTVVRLARAEDSALTAALVPEGARMRLCCNVPMFAGHPAHLLVECLTLDAMLVVLGSVAGPGWQPAEITFVSEGPATPGLRAAYAGTRFFYRAPQTSLVFEEALLARPCAIGAAAAPAPVASEPDTVADWSFATRVRELVRPYLDDGYPDIGLLAEVVGTSPRTLQRRLAESGRTYSQVVMEARFDLARDLLLNTDARVIDVAFMAGYQNPQHFSRAFRKIAGVSPRRFRKAAAAA